jgi:MoaA/NifB/PqqE/SkfB family radical SAM enzyme
MPLASETSFKLKRSCLEVKREPDDILASLLGQNFSSYRRAFRQAEAGQRLNHPLHLDVDVTTVCQLRCPMCPLGHKDQKLFPGLGLTMAEELYQAILKEASSFSLPSLRLGITGEPLLIDNIADWVSQAKQAGVLDLALITNGQLLDSANSEKLIKSGLTRLMVSIDAATEMTYAKVRPGGDFNRLYANLSAFAAKRAELNSPIPLLRLSFVVMDINEDEIDSFREKFAHLADYLSFQKYQNLTGPPVKSNFLTTEKTGIHGGVFKCTEPFVRLAIHADGGLFPCCSDFGRLSPLGRCPQDSLLDIWNSPPALTLVEASGAKTWACSECLKAMG